MLSVCFKKYVSLQKLSVGEITYRIETVLKNFWFRFAIKFECSCTSLVKLSSLVQIPEKSGQYFD